MTKLIVEMEMPRACPCELATEIEGNFYPCFAYYGVVERAVEFDYCVADETRPDWCPILGVLPEKHGDLIDRQDAIKEFEPYAEYESNRSNAEWVSRIKAVLNLMTPVIAAERKDDGN